MKKIFGTILNIIFVLSLTACGNTNSATVSESSTITSQNEQSRTENTTESTSLEEIDETITDTLLEESSETTIDISITENQESSADITLETNDSNILVVYYSASGNTKRVAEDIAEITGADLFEIVPTTIYTNDNLDWTNPDSRVNHEHEDESLRDISLVTTTVDNWDNYDTIFIGYPIWWSIAAWPINNFVKENDFTEKTVIPFATSSSSGMGQSAEILADMSGTGNWQEGQRFSSGASTDDIKEWIDTLGF